MQDEDRVRAIRDMLADHVRSPSLRHIRDPFALNKLARWWRQMHGRAPTTRRNTHENGRASV